MTPQHEQRTSFHQQWDVWRKKEENQKKNIMKDKKAGENTEIRNETFLLQQK